MNKLYRSMLWSGLVVAGVAACGDDVTVTPPPEPVLAVRSISVAPNGVTVGIGANVITMSAAVNADPGVTNLAVTWSTSDAAKASVNASGQVTTLAAGSVAIIACSVFTPSVCGNATIIIAVNAPTVTGVTVTGGGSIPRGTTLQLAASVQGTNNPPQTVTWQTSPNPAIATISATGLVTAPANSTGGNIVFTACSTVTGFTNVCGSTQIVVLIPAPTTVSIFSITQGGLGNPVTLGNVAGQIEVTLNMDNGAAPNITKAQVLIQSYGASTPTVMAEQTFGSTLRAEESADVVSQAVLSFHTDQVKKLANNLYVPVAHNGPGFISARVFVAGSSTPIASEAQPITLQNQDAMLGNTTVADLTVVQASNSPSFTNIAGTWFKGNVNVSGGNYVSFFPVTPDIRWTSNVCGTSNNATSGTPTTGITTAGVFTCGSTVEGTVSANGGWVVTPGTAPAPDVVYIAADTEDLSVVGTAFVVDGTNRYILFGGGGSVANSGPLIDNKAPTVVIQNVAYNDGYDEDWINAAYDLRNNDVISSDAGTGVATEQVVLDPVDITACNGAAVGNPHGLAESLTSAGADSYRICGQATDNIGNSSAFVGPSNPFGVDNGAPLARLAGSTGATPSIAPNNTSTVSSTPNTTIYATPAQINNQVWGLEGFDVRSGFNQAVVAGSDAATQTLTRTLASGVANCSVNDQLTVVLSDSWVRMPVLTLIECGSGLTGYYDYSGNVNDQAGNFSTTIVRNFAYDLAAPTTSFVSPAQTTYTPGQAAAFNVIASDDLEVLKAYLAFSFNGMGPPALGIIYPYGVFAGLVISSPWPSSLPIAALVPSTGVTGTISVPYLLGRIDESCTAAGVPYPSCGATPGSKTVAGEYNRDLNLNAPSSGNAAQAPTGIITNVQDIAGRDGLAGAAFSFNPVTFVTPVAQQWASATDVVTWIGKNASGDCPASTFCADQQTTNSQGLRFFDSVSLWRLNTVTNQWTYCAEMNSTGNIPFVDNGFYRIWRWTLGTSLGSSNACTGLAGFWRAMGTKAGAGLFTPSF